MTSEIEKFFNKANEKERILLRELIKKIVSGDTIGLNIKKLSGFENTFRIRKGVFRIIYIPKVGDCEIISIDRRSEQTYRKL